MFYKIVKRQSDGILTSAIAGGKAMVVYRVGEWAEPPAWLKERGYGLCLFGSKREVMDYAKAEFGWGWWRRGYEAWACEAEGVRDTCPRPSLLADLGEGRIVHYGGWDWPQNALFADRVRLVKRVR